MYPLPPPPEEEDEEEVEEKEPRWVVMLHVLETV